MSEPWTVRLEEWIESGDAVRAVERGPLREGEIVVYSEDFLRSIRCARSSTSSLKVGGETALADLSGTVIAIKKVGRFRLAKVEWDDQTTSSSCISSLSRKDPPPSISKAHARAIEEALQRGDDVPQHVLWQYPAISAKYCGVVHPDFYQHQGHMKWLRESMSLNPSDPSIWRDDLLAIIQFAWDLIAPQYHQFRKPVEYYYGKI